MNQFPSHYMPLSGLAHWQLNAYALAMCERIYPHFALYHQMVLVPEGNKLRTVIDKLWDALMSKGKYNAETLFTRLESIDIDHQDQTIGADLAMDAVSAVVAALGCFEEFNDDEAASCGLLVLESLYKYLGMDDSAPEDEVLFSQFVADHAIMQGELAIHEALIKEIKITNSPKITYLKSLKEHAQNGGVSAIGVGV